MSTPGLGTTAYSIAWTVFHLTTAIRRL